MRKSELPAGRWSVNDLTPYSGCETCRKINPPIYETIYQVGSGPRQYHYQCQGCATRAMGETPFAAGLRDLEKKEREKREKSEERRSMPLEASRSPKERALSTKGLGGPDR